jgi:sugar/nucleoside kinase (ribokinase family)
LWIIGRWLTISLRRVKVVDATGCGDTFAAALVVGWRLLGLSADAALLYALAAAAAKAMQRGAGRPLPYRQPGDPD